MALRSEAAKLWMSLSRFLKPWRTLFRTSLRASGVHPWVECPGFSKSNANTWDEGAAMWIDEHVTWVILATWSAAQHASRVGLQRSALANNSELFYVCLCSNAYFLRSRSVHHSRQLQINRLTPLQKKWNTYKSNVKSIKKDKHYNTHSLRAPFCFLACVRSIFCKVSHNPEATIRRNAITWSEALED